jgi:ubiquinone/menaquinone biosynthesis C-methylase UbiE
LREPIQMSIQQQNFAAQQYESRARDYVTSVVHSTGEDLDQIEAEVRGRSSARVLDLGCGGGHVTYRSAPHVAQVVACDVTPSMLEAVAATAAERGLRNVEVRQAAAEKLPFEDAYFDFVLCRFTTHHWHNMEAGLREARRVLKPAGRALFIDTVVPADRVLDTHMQAVELLRDISHVRNYSISEWVGGLSRSGLTAEGLTVRRLRLEFPVWIARTRTSPAHADAIRSLQTTAPAVVRDYFAIGADGSFDIDTATILARAV